MKKIILLTSIIAMTTLFSCQNKKVLAPVTSEPVVAALTTDTLNVKVFFTDTVNNFSAADYTLTVVDVTNNVVVDSVVVSGVPFLSTFPAYSGNTIKLVKNSTMDITYKVYLGGRKNQGFVSPPSTQTITVVSGNVKNTDDATNNTAPNYLGQRYTWGYGEVILTSSGTLQSQPHPNAAFSTFDTNATYVVF